MRACSIHRETLMDPRTQRLLEAPLLPLILKLAAPNMSGFLAQSAVILVEVWMIGQLGTEPLAAIALVFPLLILLLTVSGGAVGGAISSSVARYLGAGDAGSAGRLMWWAIWLRRSRYQVCGLSFSVKLSWKETTPLRVRMLKSLASEKLTSSPRTKKGKARCRAASTGKAKYHQPP